MTNPAENFFGSLLIEVFIACVLYGITTLQSFIYYQKYKNDEKLYKILVAVIWILETVHTVFCIQFVYVYLIQNFGDFEYFGSVNWGIGVSIMTEVILSTLVQSFYVRRVWIMSNKSVLLTLPIAFAVFCRLAFGTASTILSYRFDEWLSFRGHKSSLACVSGALGSAALVDVMVALSLSICLMRGRSKWHSQSKGRINKLMLYAVNTGAITGTASLLSVVLYATQTTSLVFLGLVEIQGKLYANSLLGSLNARSSIRKTNAEYPSLESYSHSQNGFRSVAPPVPKVEVFRQTVVTDDMGRQDSNYDMQTLKSGELV